MKESGERNLSSYVRGAVERDLRSPSDDALLALTERSDVHHKELLRSLRRLNIAQRVQYAVMEQSFRRLLGYAMVNRGAEATVEAQGNGRFAEVVKAAGMMNLASFDQAMKEMHDMIEANLRDFDLAPKE